MPSPPAVVEDASSLLCRTTMKALYPGVPRSLGALSREHIDLYAAILTQPIDPQRIRKAVSGLPGLLRRPTSRSLRPLARSLSARNILVPPEAPLCAVHRCLNAQIVASVTDHVEDAIDAHLPLILGPLTTSHGRYCGSALQHLDPSVLKAVSELEDVMAAFLVPHEFSHEFRRRPREIWTQKASTHCKACLLSVIGSSEVLATLRAVELVRKRWIVPAEQRVSKWLLWLDAWVDAFGTGSRGDKHSVLSESKRLASALSAVLQDARAAGATTKLCMSDPAAVIKEIRRREKDKKALAKQASGVRTHVNGREQSKHLPRRSYDTQTAPVATAAMAAENADMRSFHGAPQEKLAEPMISPSIYSSCSTDVPSLTLDSSARTSWSFSSMCQTPKSLPRNLPFTYAKNWSMYAPPKDESFYIPRDCPQGTLKSCHDYSTKRVTTASRELSIISAYAKSVTYCPCTPLPTAGLSSLLSPMAAPQIQPAQPKPSVEQVKQAKKPRHSYRASTRTYADPSQYTIIPTSSQQPLSPHSQAHPPSAPAQSADYLPAATFQPAEKNKRSPGVDELTALPTRPARDNRHVKELRLGWLEDLVDMVWEESRGSV
ncbi:hypothetical protein MRB53_036850 [Persea americana]|nr:hypothetical protein MRB53_036850 [Persea americana]